MTAPGWYPDGQGNQRYWDGQGWTEQIAAPAQPVAPPPAPYMPPAPSAGRAARKKSHKKRNIVLGVVAALIVIGAIASAAGGGKKNDDDSNAANSTSNHVTGSSNSSAPSSPKVSTGLGSNKAVADVAVGKPVKDATLDSSSVKVSVTNHSSKRSDYFITVALETADGKTQIDTATVFVQNLEPGQSSVQTGEFLQTLSDPAPDDAKAVLQEVERTAST